MQKTTKQQSNGQTSDLAKIEEIKTPIRKPFVLKTPAGSITDAGIRELQDYLVSNALGCVPEDFDPVWVNAQGTLPKRVQRHFYKRSGLKMSVEQVSEVGNIAKRNASTEESVVLDFTNRIDWRHGDFGDRGSCFWGDKSGAKDMLEDNGGLAVRAFKQRNGSESLDYSNLIGYARAWLVNIGSGKFVVFNGYGESTLTFARWLATLWKRTYKRIGLTNQGDDGGVLWINSCNYIIGQWQQIAEISNYDFGWEEPCEACRCPICENEFNEDDGITALNSEGFSIFVCSDCAAFCEVCERNFTEGVHFSDSVRMYECTDCRMKREDREEAEQEAEEVKI